MTRAFGQKMTVAALVLLAAGILLFLVPFPESERFFIGGVPLILAFPTGIAGVIISNYSRD